VNDDGRTASPAFKSAFGAKSKWTGRQSRLTQSKMTQSELRSASEQFRFVKGLATPVMAG
jgi:hypothetical protein